MNLSTLPHQELFASKIYWTVPDPVPDSVYQSIAQQVAAGSDPAVDVPAASFIWHMVARHIVVYNAPVSGIPTFVNGVAVDWGNCGAPSGGIPTGGITALSDINLGVGAATGVSAAVVGALGGAAGASAAGLGFLATAVPIIGTAIAAGLLPFELIFQHHAAAVAKEQGTICSCSQEINQWLDAVDQAVASGAVLPADGVSMVNQLSQQYTQCLTGISAACSPGHTNAACDNKGVMEAMVLLRTWMYNNLPQFNPHTAVSSGAPQASPSQLPTVSGVQGYTGAPAAAAIAVPAIGGNLIWVLLAILAGMFL
jgi:hypothetical protein